MPKGRVFAPDGCRDGNWYVHVGLPGRFSETPARFRDTSTGLMLSEPYKPDSTHIPFPPPRGYYLRDSRNFKLTNDFSEHNNRHLLQGTGEYFGDGGDSRSLGRRLAAPHLRHHTTPGTFLHDDCHSVMDGNSMYYSSFSSVPRSAPAEHRRFPRRYEERSPGSARLSTTTTSWFRAPDVPYEPPLQLLASSQEPFLKPNRWKYSYHSLERCYPPYEMFDRKQGICKI